MRAPQDVHAVAVVPTHVGMARRPMREALAFSQ